MSVQSFQIFSASCVECAAVTAMCQASVMSWSFSFRTSWSSSRPAPRSNQKPALTIHSHHSPTGCTMHQLQSKKPCSWWSKCANAWCKWPCAHAHTWTTTTHHRTTELSRDMCRYAIWKGLMTSYSNHKLSMLAIQQTATCRQVLVGRIWFANKQFWRRDESSPLKQKALGVATVHLPQSLKIFSLKTMQNHFQYCQVYIKQHNWCEVMSDAHSCVGAAIQNRIDINRIQHLLTDIMGIPPLVHVSCSFSKKCPKKIQEGSKP